MCDVNVRSEHLSRSAGVSEAQVCVMWLLTSGIAEAGCAAQSRPLQVEAVFAALAVASLGISGAVDAVQAPGVPQAVTRPAIAAAT